MRWLLLLVLVACGPKKQPNPVPDDDLEALDGPEGKPAICASNSPEHWTDEVTPPEGDTEIQRRQHAACNAVVPTMTACAVTDACENMEPKELNKLDVEPTAKVHARENLKSCLGTPMSTHQVRVYEVCYEEEQNDCAALAACLENAQPQE